jgi:hypothetical protein
MQRAWRLVAVLGLVVGALVVRIEPAAADTAAAMATTRLGQVVTDEARQQVFVSATEADAVYVYGYDGGLIMTIGGIGRPVGMVLRGTTLYVAASSTGRIERIDVTTRTRGAFLAAGIPGLQTLAYAAGRLWTVSPCGQWDGKLVSVELATGATVFHESTGFAWISYCGWLLSDPTSENQLLGWSQGLSPPTIERWNVAAVPTVISSRRIEYGASVATITASPDGTRLFPAYGAPYEMRELRSDNLEDSGTVYPANPYPTATAATAGRGGLVAVGTHYGNSTDLWVYDIGNPSALRYRADFDTGVVPRGLAFSADGTRLFAVTEGSVGGNLVFRMLDITGSSPLPVPVPVSPAPSGSGGGGTAAAAIEVDRTSLPFGEQRVGTYGDVGVVEVRNTGTAPMTVSEVAITSGAIDEFGGATDCLDSPVAPGGTCHVALLFLPLMLGERQASLDIRSDGGQRTVSLRGTGTEGYVLGFAEGGALGFGDSDIEDVVDAPLNRPAVGMGRTANGDGVWLVAGDGGIFSFGDAPFYGSTGNIRLNQPFVGIATTPSGGGYWLVAADGGIFSFGDAAFYGSTGNLRLNKPIVGMAATPSGRGYWLVASDGGMFTFGDASFYGSTGDLRLNKPIVGMAATPSGRGYWLVASDGGIFTFGDARFFGSAGNLRLAKPIVGIASTPAGGGYWMVASDGGIFTFGDAPFYGSAGGTGFDDVIGMVPTAPPVDLGEGGVVASSAGRRTKRLGRDTGPEGAGFADLVPRG